jgi:hypothetical protein
VRERYLAWTIALGLTAVALAFGARGVGGADDYGYVSQAELWLHGQLKTDQSFVADAPFPRAAAAFAPLGYLHDPRDSNVLVPAYAPGLPIVLALVKAAAGQTAMFYVIPISAGLLVLVTYGLGRRLGSGAAGLTGAWLVATSPVVIYMSMLTMTDVPVAVIWTGVFYFLLADTTWSAFVAGLLTSLAILVRPNLVPLGAIVGLYYIWKLVIDDRGRALRRLLAFGIAALPGPLAVAVLNNYLYGSPTSSGYGNLERLFVRSNIPINLRMYLGWLIESHTPIVLCGLVALVIPTRRLWPNVRDRSVFAFAAAFIAVLWTIYCAWKIFDGWFFCRLLLASWPWMMLGVGSLASALILGRGRLRTAIVVTGVVALGLYQIWFAKTHSAFEVGRQATRYAVTARLVRDVTQPNSVVLSINHSGAIRYYGGRMTINIVNFDASLDEIVDWLTRHQIHAYAALEDWEVPVFRQRFAGARRLAGVAQPIVTLENFGKFEIFDLTNPYDASGQAIVVRTMKFGWRAPVPATAPRLVLR